MAHDLHMKTVRAFARIAGVTPKTLRHYERRRLLAPRRNAAGYRVYSERDRRRVREVLALKSLGLSLTEIRELLDGRRAPLEALRAQRESLERKRRSLDRAIEVISEVERAEEAHPSAARALSRLIAEAAWSDGERRREEAAPVPRPPDRASPSRVALAQETLRAIDAAGPAELDALRAKWRALIDAEVAEDPSVAEEVAKAYANRRHWPRGMREWAASLYEMDAQSFERMTRFISELAPPRRA